jgi:hypothetical protein
MSFNKYHKYINIIQKTENHTQVTTKGIKKGDEIKKLLDAYGVPTGIIEFGNSESYTFTNSRIVFELINNKVTGWFVYLP